MLNTQQIKPTLYRMLQNPVLFTCIGKLSSIHIFSNKQNIVTIQYIYICHVWYMLHSDHSYACFRDNNSVCIHARTHARTTQNQHLLFSTTLCLSYIVCPKVKTQFSKGIMLSNYQTVYSDGHVKSWIGIHTGSMYVLLSYCWFWIFPRPVCITLLQKVNC